MFRSLLNEIIVAKLNHLYNVTPRPKVCHIHIIKRSCCLLHVFQITEIVNVIKNVLIVILV